MQIENMKKGDWGKVKAFFDIKTQEGFTMKGFKLVEGVNGLFAGFPSQKNKENEYHDTVWADRDLKDEVSAIAVKQYKNDDIGEMGLGGIKETVTEEDPELPF